MSLLNEITQTLSHTNTRLGRQGLPRRARTPDSQKQRRSFPSCVEYRARVDSLPTIVELLQIEDGFMYFQLHLIHLRRPHAWTWKGWIIVLILQRLITVFHFRIMSIPGMFHGDFANEPETHRVVDDQVLLEIRGGSELVASIYLASHAARSRALREHARSVRSVRQRG
jgi:hypothetical protein